MKQLGKSIAALMLVLTLCLVQTTAYTGTVDNGIMPSSFLEDIDCTA